MDRYVTTLQIDFVLHRDRRGYRLLPAKLPPRRPNQEDSERILSANMDDLTERIVGIGGPVVRYKPLSKIPQLFIIFAKTARTPRGVLDFINTYGHFTNAGIAGGHGDLVGVVLDEAKKMSMRLDRLSAVARIGTEIPVTNLHAVLVTDRATGGFELKITPATLRDALWLQLAQSISKNCEIRKCKHCGEWFRAGSEAHRRGDAKFCSDEHQKRFNSLERSR
jgi:hypothetical protein